MPEIQKTKKGKAVIPMKKAKAVSRPGFLETVKRYKWIYLLLLFPMVYYLIFHYVPMYGVLMAFKDYKYKLGVLGSPWTGLDNFKLMFGVPYFWSVLRNTVLISLGRIVFEFPVPIILALLLNEITNSKLKRFYQTVFTFPNFISWVVISGMLINIFGNNGIIAASYSKMGWEFTGIMNEPGRFLVLLFGSSVWKSAGWGSIIYLAAITGIDTALYDAAAVDGASRFKQMLYVTLPGLMPTIVVMLILNCGSILNAGFDQIFNLYNPLVRDSVDIIDTYVYRITFAEGGDFAFSTAVGLFKSVVNCILLVTVNKLVDRTGYRGIY